MPARLRWTAAVGPLTGALLLAACAGEPSSAPAARETGLDVRGADLSFTPELEAAGITYRDSDGQVRPVERIVAAAGATHVRLRVWVDPPSGRSDLDSALTMARRARDAGMQVLLDLHYSDTWADEEAQATPAAWRGQDLVSLSRTVHDYTRDVVAAFAQQGTPVAMVQVGNEITLGMLWPTGQVFRGGAEDWTAFGRLLRAGVSGARAGASPAPEVLVHSTRSADVEGARWFHDGVLAAGVDPDVLALTYYPFFNGALDELAATLDELARRYGKDVLVVETAYPWTLDDGDHLANEASSRGQLPDADRFPPTPTGQAAYYEALREVLLAVPGGHGRGFVVWEPGWLPGVGWQPGEGNQYDNTTLFDWQGRALPALRAFRAELA